MTEMKFGMNEWGFPTVFDSIINSSFIVFSKSYDWGLYSIDTYMDRRELRGNAFLALANFGDHALHHLFPTLDHGLLGQLYDILFQTLNEFEAELQCYSWFDSLKGQFLQLSRVELMTLDPQERYALKMKKSKQQ